MAPERYDSQWKEVEVINGYVLLGVYVGFAIRGIAYLVVTWTTVVLLGGFVSMIDKKDFQRLTLITLIQILWINVNFIKRAGTSMDLLSSLKTVKDLLMRRWQPTHKARGDHPYLVLIKRVFAAIRAVVGRALALVHRMLFVLCIFFAICLFQLGLAITTSLSIYSLVNHNYYGDKDEGRTNMDPAHNILYILCLAQGALFLYLIFLARCEKRIVSQVSKSYGFQDDDRAVFSYFREIMKACIRDPSSARERNLITHALELMESKSPSSFLTGTLILDRLLTRQHLDKIKAPTFVEEENKKQQELDFEDKTGGPHLIKKGKKEKREERRNEKREERKKKREERKKHQQTEEEIIVQQRRVIKGLIGSASSTHILQKLLDTLDSRHSDDKKMREAAARIVEHVASTIRLDQFPRGIQSISSLINSFEEYCQLQPHQLSSSLSTHNVTTRSPPSSKTKKDHDQEQGNSNTSLYESDSEYTESDLDSDVTQSSPKALHGYKDVVLTGLRILWSLAGSEHNCVIISKTNHLVSKIVAPVSCDLVHRAGHSAWSTKVSETSLGVIFRLIVTAQGDTRAKLCQQISSDEGAVSTMKRIVTCEKCKGGELQMKAMQILTQLCMDETENRGNLAKVLVSIFTNGDSCDGSIRKTAGKTLVVLFLSTKSVASLLPKEENDKFVGDLAKILLQVGDKDTCKSAAEILEHLCMQYTENGQYLSTLNDTMIGLMPKVLREILSGLTGEEGNPGYARSGTDVESQVTTNNDTNNNNHTSSSPGRNKHHKLHVALLSLWVTACDKLHLDLDTISLGETGDQARDQGEFVVFSLALKMVQINRDLITPDNLKAMKLITRMVIAAMKKLPDYDTVVERADLESLMNSLSSISETMLDLEGCMVFAAGSTTKVSATANTLDSLVKQARQLHSEIKNQESEINLS